MVFTEMFERNTKKNKWILGTLMTFSQNYELVILSHIFPVRLLYFNLLRLDLEKKITLGF